jgi:hypothetical protein
VNYIRIAEMLSDAIASDAESEEGAKFVISYCLKVTLETACYRQMSLNGSGLIAEYLTVFAILAWPR